MLFYAHKKRTNVLFNPRKGLTAMQGEFRGSFGDFLAMKRKEANLTIKDAVDHLERELILDALDRFDGNKKKVASQLGVSRSYLYKKLAEIEETADAAE